MFKIYFVTREKKDEGLGTDIAPFKLQAIRDMLSRLRKVFAARQEPASGEALGKTAVQYADWFDCIRKFGEDDAAAEMTDTAQKTLPEGIVAQKREPLSGGVLPAPEDVPRQAAQKDKENLFFAVDERPAEIVVGEEKPEPERCASVEDGVRHGWLSAAAELDAGRAQVFLAEQSTAFGEKGAADGLLSFCYGKTDSSLQFWHAGIKVSAARACKLPPRPILAAGTAYVCGGAKAFAPPEEWDTKDFGGELTSGGLFYVLRFVPCPESSRMVENGTYDDLFVIGSKNYLLEVRHSLRRIAQADEKQIAGLYNQAHTGQAFEHLPEAEKLAAIAWYWPRVEADAVPNEAEIDDGQAETRAGGELPQAYDHDRGEECGEAQCKEPGAKRFHRASEDCPPQTCMTERLAERSDNNNTPCCTAKEQKKSTRFSPEALADEAGEPSVKAAAARCFLPEESMDERRITAVRDVDFSSPDGRRRGGWLEALDVSADLSDPDNLYDFVFPEGNAAEGWQTDVGVRVCEDTVEKTERADRGNTTIVADKLGTEQAGDTGQSWPEGKRFALCQDETAPVKRSHRVEALIAENSLLGNKRESGTSNFDRAMLDGCLEWSLSSQQGSVPYDQPLMEKREAMAWRVKQKPSERGRKIPAANGVAHDGRRNIQARFYKQNGLIANRRYEHHFEFADGNKNLAKLRDGVWFSDDTRPVEEKDFAYIADQGANENLFLADVYYTDSGLASGIQGGTRQLFSPAEAGGLAPASQQINEKEAAICLWVPVAFDWPDTVAKESAALEKSRRFLEPRRDEPFFHGEKWAMRESGQPIRRNAIEYDEMHFSHERLEAAAAKFPRNTSAGILPGKGRYMNFAADDSPVRAAGISGDLDRQIKQSAEYVGENLFAQEHTDGKAFAGLAEKQGLADGVSALERVNHYYRNPFAACTVRRETQPPNRDKGRRGVNDSGAELAGSLLFSQFDSEPVPADAESWHEELAEQTPDIASETSELYSEPNPEGYTIRVDAKTRRGKEHAAAAVQQAFAANLNAGSLRVSMNMKSESSNISNRELYEYLTNALS